MAGLRSILRECGSELADSSINRLHMLLSDWQILCDLHRADAVLWIATGENRFLAVAHCRPATGATIHLADVVGKYAPPGRERQLQEIFSGRAEPEIQRSIRWAGSYSVIETVLPVRFEGKIIAGMSLEVNSESLRGSEVESNWFNELANILCEMIAQGKFPDGAVPSASIHGIPRVADGVIFLDEEGRVIELSPNAESCLRRIGIPQGIHGAILARAITEVVQNESAVDESLPVVVMGRAAWLAELHAKGGTLSLRAVPLWRGVERVGAILLCRDVTEMRRREQELITKDATIREIHHRVKNNLQTVSALLRMQARRSKSIEVKQALDEAERRVSIIAKVHEQLSQTVDESVHFDDMISHLLRMSAAMAATELTVQTRFEGSFGIVDADAASGLAVVISELVSNAVEHGFSSSGGEESEILLTAERNGDHLLVQVIDNGKGLAEGQELSGLGTSIVKTLVAGELDGTIDWDSHPGAGTTVTINAYLGRK